MRFTLQLTNPLGRELRPNGAEVTEACWVPAQELHRFSMTPGTRHVLARLFPADLADPGQPADELAERVRATGSP